MLATFRSSKATQNHVEISQDFGDVPEVFSDALLCSAGGGAWPHIHEEATVKHRDSVFLIIRAISMHFA